MKLENPFSRLFSAKRPIFYSKYLEIYFTSLDSWNAFAF